MPRFPGGSWSHTLSNDLQNCLRKVYYRVYGSWGGWTPKNGREAHELYTAKNSRSLAMHAGVLVHDCIKLTLQHVRAGRTVDMDRFLARIGQRFTEEVAYSAAGHYEQARSVRNATLILNDHLAGRDVNDGEIEEFTERCRDSMRAFIDRFLPELLELGPDRWLMVDSLDAVEYDGCRLFMAPDLVTASTEQRFDITDWKTGTRPDVEQLAIYILYWKMRCDARGQPILSEDIHARSVPLRGGPEDVGHLQGSDEILARALERIEADIRILKDLHQAGLDKDKSSFSRTIHKGSCKGCVYKHICEFDD